MSQLDSAITSLVTEHGTFISKGQQFLGRKAQARQQASDDRDVAQVAQTASEGSEALAATHEASALVARNSARDSQRAAHDAYRENREAVAEAKRARLHAEAVAAGDLDRYTQWLLNTPVAQGTLHLDWETDTYRVATGESLGLSTKDQAFAEDGSLLAFDAWLGPKGTYLLEHIWSDGSVIPAGYGVGVFLYEHDGEQGTLYRYGATGFSVSPKALAAQFGTGFKAVRVSYFPRLLLERERGQTPYSTFVTGAVSSDIWHTSRGEVPPHYFGSSLLHEGSLMVDESGQVLVFE